MVRKQVYLEHSQDAKLKRLARATGKTEAELIREALDRLPETDNPVQVRLREAGLLLEPPRPDLRAVGAAEAAYREALGNRSLGLAEAFLEERRSGR